MYQVNSSTLFRTRQEGKCWSGQTSLIRSFKNKSVLEHESMVKDVFLFSARRCTQKDGRKLLTAEKLLFAQMLRHAGRQQRLFMFSFHGEEPDVRRLRMSLSLTGRPASAGANSSTFFCLVSVSDMRSGECRLTHQLSVAVVAAAGGAGFLKSLCVVI